MVERSEGLRREGLGQIVELIAERWGLRSGLDTTEATDLLLMLSSSGPYLTLRRYGWSEATYASWLTETLTRDLLG